MAFTVDEKNKNKIISLISAIIPNAKIYLFGSRARGTNSEWSDIDLAIDLGAEAARLDIGELNDIMVASNLPYKVDIVDFYKVTPEMQQSILKDKIIWKN